jgi:hypothetical protein
VEGKKSAVNKKTRHQFCRVKEFFMLPFLWLPGIPVRQGNSIGGLCFGSYRHGGYTHHTCRRIGNSEIIISR